MKKNKFYKLGLAAVTAGALSLSASFNLAQAADKLTIAVPGVPPVFSTTLVYVSKLGGFYKKHGLDVTIKPFNSGVAAARAVVSGAVEVSLSPTAPVTRMVSNAGVSLVGMQGMEKPDWLIGSMDPKKNTCESMKGQAVGVDSPRGARWIQLANMARKCKLRADKDIPTVNLSSNVGAAMVAGQLTFGVLHLDDIPVIERESGKKVTIVSEIEKAAPGTHYLLFVAKRETIAKKRDIMVRMTAAQIEATEFIYNPANRAKIAGFAKATGRKQGDAENAFKIFTDFKYWARGSDGMDAKRITKTIKIQEAVGKRTKGKAGINPAKGGVAVDKLIDRSIYKDAVALLKK